MAKKKTPKVPTVRVEDPDKLSIRELKALIRKLKAKST